jgi:hypothetical protein
MILQITNGFDIIKLKDKYCVPLELEINKISNHKDWVAIGDHLYYFLYPDTTHVKSSNTLNVTEEKYDVIKNIIQTKNFN